MGYFLSLTLNEMRIPVLMITCGRLEFTKQALNALLQCEGVSIYLFDNGSEDKTHEWLLKMMDENLQISQLFVSEKNRGIAYAMNWFLKETEDFEFCAKCDNDTLLSKDFFTRMLPYMKWVDVVQAKHSIIPATNPEGWKGFTKNMKRENGLIYNHFVGGSGIMFRRSLVTSIPETEWKIGGWRQWQREHPEVRKAFCEDVTIELLDTTDAGTDYSKYEDYYKQTGRL